MTSTERTHAVLEGRRPDRLPVVPLFMVWAAQHGGHSYADYVTDYRVLVEDQLRLWEEFGIDVLSCCSDAWREAADCGTLLVYDDEGPPRPREHLLANKRPVTDLPRPDPLGGGRMTDRVRAVELFRKRGEGRVPILGWIEGPISEAVNLRGMNQFMLDFVDDPSYARSVLQWTAELATDFALAQVGAGADLIGMGDAAASLISPSLYCDFVLDLERDIIATLEEAGALTRLHICGNTTGLLPYFASTCAALIDLDHMVDLAAARRAIGSQTTLLGNFDPVNVLLKASAEDVYAACARCHAAAGEPYMLAAGCEVPPGTPEVNVRAVVRYAEDATRGGNSAWLK